MKHTKTGIVIPITDSTKTISHTSHEMKSFVTSSKAFVQLLERRVKKDSLDPKLLEYLGRMDIQLSRLNNQISDFFDVLKLETNTLELFLEQTQLSDLIDSAVTMTGKLGFSQKIVVKHIEDCIVLVDTSRMERALVHILINAAKYSEEGKIIELETHKDNKNVYVTVSNMGIPIERSEKEKIFQVFYQSEKSGHQQGIGVGLYFAQKIAKLHKGNVLLDVTPKDKTVFTLIIPLG